MRRLPAFALTHWPPMIGVVETFGTGPAVKSIGPTGVTDLQRAHRLGDLGLVLRIAAVRQGGEAGVEQRHAGADLLLPLLPVAFS